MSQKTEAHDDEDRLMSPHSYPTAFRVGDTKSQ
jgi:hypothetical protein